MCGEGREVRLPQQSRSRLNSRKKMKQPIASLIICLSIVSTILMAAEIATAQQPMQGASLRRGLPPGVAANLYRSSRPSLASKVQPVRVISPTGSKLDVAYHDGFSETGASQVSVGMMIGPVYRFKISNIPQHPDKELYPSIEILDALCPPEGMENDFPIQVVIEQDDLQQALAGRLVTKVVYLEDPETAMPHRHRAGTQPFFDVGRGGDPLRAAAQLGRPMAILRIGSRIPMPSDLADQFNFSAPPATLLPDPQPINTPVRHDATNASPLNSVKPIQTPDNR